ncbi:class I SAM-dependent methyltransferase [Microbacterium sp. B35-30]|uniref:class I SAM-dependent methyltransferase n=1 Tax=Microbacterium sp. B35-30 TaxID=1962642 RepID=UPI0013D727ED|nr:class I SAM-dependent methyltransferase [Microbacterium sp. B35-30]KAF2420805.1 SAM-dependent methyltransferase [Microbacterium sp. B35-30]
MADGMHFEKLADEYATARPSYPPQLWRRLHDLGLLRPGTTALDLGAGSGQATGTLLAAGLRVTAIEPGRRLSRLLRESYPTATVQVARAEDVELPASSFDLVVAATAIHWMDLSIVLPRVRTALTDGGRLAVWRNVFGDFEAPPTPFRERVAEIVRARRAPARTGPPAEDLTAMTGALTESGLFTVADASTYRWSLDLDADGVGSLFRTFSDWSPAEVAQAVDAVRELGGTVTEHYSSWLLVLAPTSRESGS